MKCPLFLSDFSAHCFIKGGVQFFLLGICTKASLQTRNFTLSILNKRSSGAWVIRESYTGCRCLFHLSSIQLPLLSSENTERHLHVPTFLILSSYLHLIFRGKFSTFAFMHVTSFAYLILTDLIILPE